MLAMEIMEAHKDLVMSICLLALRFAGRKKVLIMATITEASLPT